MPPIKYIDRVSGKKEIDKVYAEAALRFFYGDGISSRFFGRPINYLWARNPIFSSMYGWWQSLSCTKRNVRTFIERYGVDASEFEDSVDSFSSFNEFFIRKLKASARPIAAGNGVAVIPADGRYLFFPNIQTSEGFLVKGKKFNLSTLLDNENLPEDYREGTMVIARLCPSDYHRFHFPCDSTPNAAELINGWLYSVNPIAIKRDIDIFTQNKRTLTHLDGSPFGKVLYIEVGATNVGSITQTYAPNQFQAKGKEKGYFSFGASTLILLFPPNSIVLDSDLLAASHQGIEIKCLMGQSMGKKLSD
ncbi:MAG: phosphatidylserine decarboxylase [Parachlamydiaceae bacterium]|nr:phosphatidylserine decarboxylase [Parachlamydiaceae bacterium]